MNIFLITIEDKIQLDCFTSLKDACLTYNVSYDSAKRNNKRSWIKPIGTIKILKGTLVKVAGRGGIRVKGLSKKNKSIDNQEY